MMKNCIFVFVFLLIPVTAVFADDGMCPADLYSETSPAYQIARGNIGVEGEIHLYNDGRYNRRHTVEYASEGIKMEDKIIKIGVDFAGKQNIDWGSYYNSGYGYTPFDGTTDVAAGFNLTGELVEYLNAYTGIGGGITYQAPRKQTDYDGNFNFIPIYFLMRLRTMPVRQNEYKYFVMHLGFNIFSGDSDYKGAGGELENGAYWAIGGGMVFNKLQFELLYNVNTGGVRQSGYAYDSTTGTNNYYEIKSNIQYSALSFSVGYNF